MKYRAGRGTARPGWHQARRACSRSDRKSSTSSMPTDRRQQGLPDAEVGPLLRGDGGMGHESGMLDQAFHPAQAFREGENPACLQKAASPGEIGGQFQRDMAKIEHRDGRFLAYGCVSLERRKPAPVRQADNRARASCRAVGRLAKQKRT